MPIKLSGFPGLWHSGQTSNALLRLGMICTREWTFSDLGTPIELHASHSWDDLRSLRPILMIGGVHGDEPLGVHLAKSTLQYLQDEAGKAHSQVKVPWALIPVLNVDGFVRNTRVNGRGVDLNRNYPARSWRPEFEKDRYNPGPSPGSEKEIQAVVQFITQAHPRLIIHYHSWKPMIVCAGESGMKDAERLSRASGYQVVPEIGYPTPGSLSQFGWVDRQIPVICIEEDDDALPQEVWPRFQNGMREIFLDASPR
ncbi:MAG: M14 family zinc carboxypeptidase [Bdellovibrionales bacterium]